MKIGIINYGIGNVGSVYSALRFYGYDAFLVGDTSALKGVDLIVLAGVGNFNAAVRQLKRGDLWRAINDNVVSGKKPIIGICLGMQLFADTGYEGGRTKGFGWIPGKVVKMDEKRARIPHMGWNKVEYGNNRVFNGMRYGFFYYMHSYQFVPEDRRSVVATTRYGDTEIVAAVRNRNIIGVQFHPEKSQGDGLRLLKNMVEELT